MNIKKIEKDFEERFISDDGTCPYPLNKLRNACKNFIRQSILSIIDFISLEERIFPNRESDEYDEGWNDKTNEIKEWKESVIK